MMGRRVLSFATLDEVMPEIERLLAGHTTVSHWTLGQICYHLAVALRLTAESRLAVASRPANQAVRDQILVEGRFPEGVTAPAPILVPGPDLDDRAEAEGLRQAIDQFASAPGRFGDHPRLGPMTREDWTRFHCVHCAHHLGFVLPTEPT